MLAAAGVASRRACEDLIAAGRVSVNGAVVNTQGTTVDATADRVAVDGKPLALAAAPKTHVFAVNKPKGYICSNVETGDKAEAGKRVVDLLAPWLEEWRRRNPGKVRPAQAGL